MASERPKMSAVPNPDEKLSKSQWRERALRAEGERDLLKEALKHEPSTPSEDLFDTIVNAGEKAIEQVKAYEPVVRGFLKKLTTKE